MSSAMQMARRRLWVPAAQNMKQPSKTSSTAAESTTTDPTTTKTRKYVDEIYFPNIREHILNPTPDVKLRVPCFSCTDDLDIKGLNPPGGDDDDVDLDDIEYDSMDEETPTIIEPARVLRCGHVVGKKCFREWIMTLFETADSAPIQVACPTCRTSMYCPHCGHLLAEMIIPGEDSPFNVPDVPLLEIESHGVTPQHQPCAKCHLRIVLSATVWLTLGETQLGQNEFSAAFMNNQTLGAIVQNDWITFISDRSQQWVDEFSPSPILNRDQQPRYMADLQISRATTMPFLVRNALSEAADKMRDGLVPAIYMPTWTARDSWAQRNKLNALWSGEWPPQENGLWAPPEIAVIPQVPDLVAHVGKHYASEPNRLKRIQMMWCEIGDFIDPTHAMLMRDWEKEKKRLLWKIRKPYQESQHYLYAFRFGQIEKYEDDDEAYDSEPFEFAAREATEKVEANDVDMVESVETASGALVEAEAETEAAGQDDSDISLIG